MANGKWQMANGKWQRGGVSVPPPCQAIIMRLALVLLAIRRQSDLDDQAGIDAGSLMGISERIADHPAPPNPIIERGVGMTVNP